MKLREKEYKPRTRKILSRSPEDTHKLGMEIAHMVPIPGVVLLRGDLGMGKTTLTRGIAEGLGMKDPDRVNSPSFTLVNIYQGICPIYHVDLYRLEGARELYSIGIDDFLGNDGITIVEWSERLASPVPNAIEVSIQDAGADSRIFHVVMPRKAREIFQ